MPSAIGKPDAWPETGNSAARCAAGQVANLRAEVAALRAEVLRLWAAASGETLNQDALISKDQESPEGTLRSMRQSPRIGPVDIDRHCRPFVLARGDYLEHLENCQSHVCIDRKDLLAMLQAFPPVDDLTIVRNPEPEATDAQRGIESVGKNAASERWATDARKVAKVWPTNFGGDFPVR